ncbi:MAG: thiamine phosphate synthase [Kiritimatiellae bacterium]|nr:thiamine phosphate synthase [Kiritimatiellia bacterium]
MTHDERMRYFLRAGLYFVTSRAMSNGRGTSDIVKHALAGGVKLVQLREKNIPLQQLLDLAYEVRKLTSDAGALLIINDRLDVAQAVGADGVHLGQDDFPVADARRICPDMIIGASSHNEEEAKIACADGASYVNIGPLFTTQTKEWNDDYLGLEGLQRISAVMTVPFTVMGGIKKRHIPDLVMAGARTIAVVSAITAVDDPCEAAKDLLSCIKEKCCEGIIA